MAISAEYYMLENMAIQRLLAVREKEIDYMEKWINGISTRAALMSGFVVTVFAGIAVQVKTINDDDDAYNTELQQVYLDIFLSVTMVALGSGVHCMLTSTFTAIWGPGLALRGPKGSVAKAYAAMRRQKHQITGSFVALIIFFFIQTGIAVWLCPISAIQKWVATSIVIFSALFTVRTMRDLHQQFFTVFKCFGHTLCSKRAPSPSDVLVERMSTISTGERRTSINNRKDLPDTAPKMGDLGLPLLSRLAKHPDMAASKPPGSLNSSDNFRSETSVRPRHEGLISKKSAKKRRFKMEQWADRYMVLDGSAFCYWHSVEDYERGVLPSKGNVYGLQGYHVLIDPEDPKWGFTLKPLASNRPTFEFRAESEPERVAWVTAFVSACLLAADGDHTAQPTSTFHSGSTDFGGLSSGSFFEGDEAEDGEETPVVGSSMTASARAPGGPTMV